MGKTRLALQIACELRENHKYKEGICFVDLSSITNTEETVGDTILKALGLIPNAGLSTSLAITKYLENKDFLLLIDNFEHLLGLPQWFRIYLISSEKLTILTTSREALNLTGEQIYPVFPLPLPNLTNKRTQPGSREITNQ